VKLTKRERTIANEAHMLGRIQGDKAMSGSEYEAMIKRVAAVAGAPKRRRRPTPTAP
jgi:hypothetical protein